MSRSEIAERLLQETLRDLGAVEIGYKAGLRWTIQLQEQAVKDGSPGLTLNEKTVFVVTGAAGSIVSAITADLAAASGGTFYLLDLVPQPDPTNPDLQRFVTDKDGLKQEIFKRLQAGGGRVTPVMVEKELAAIERGRAALDAIQAVTASGGKAHYFSLDLKDSDAVDAAVQQIRKQNGRVDVLLHAAGLERSHLLSDKDSREFNLVFDVKADGFFNLLRSIGNMPLGSTVAFSSIAGRFGNAGQTDYSAANDLLCKITSSIRRTHPATRAIAIDWTAWNGIGMAARGSIPKMMESAGIDMLPPEAGIPVVRREITSGSFQGEVLIGQRLGILESEWDLTGGMAAHDAKAGPMIGASVAMSPDGKLQIETSLDPAEQPFLHDHQIEGTPVLPGVMGLEAFAEASSFILPSYHLQALEDVDFQAPFKFYRNQVRTITLEAGISQDAAGMVAHCTLSGKRKPANAAEPTITTHFTGRVRLARDKEPIETLRRVVTPVEPIIEGKDIYRVYFHGPAHQVVDRAWRDGDRMIGKLKNNLPANQYPADKPTLIAPRLIELCD